MESILTGKLIEAIVAQYGLPLSGTHGITHWARVYENGLLLARRNGANITVVELFAVFHDAGRINERGDHEHGRRGAGLARALRGSHFDLPDEDLDLLDFACTHHTSGYTQADLTVQTCWDADRLDLGRVGITPLPERLCTPEARDPDVLSWAHDRAVRRDVPPLIAGGWQLD
jgi:uncharacterized protein